MTLRMVSIREIVDCTGEFMPNRTIVIPLCIIAALAFALPIIPSIYMQSGSPQQNEVDPSALRIWTYAGSIAYILLVLFLLFALPLWVWFRPKRRLTSIVTACVGFTFGYLVYSYTLEPEISKSHGSVGSGLLFYFPPLYFFVQLVLYNVDKLVQRVKTKLLPE